MDMDASGRERWDLGVSLTGGRARPRRCCPHEGRGSGKLGLGGDCGPPRREVFEGVVERGEARGCICGSAAVLDFFFYREIMGQLDMPVFSKHCVVGCKTRLWPLLACFGWWLGGKGLEASWQESASHGREMVVFQLPLNADQWPRVLYFDGSSCIFA